MFILEKANQEEIELIKETRYYLMQNNKRTWDIIKYKGKIIKLEKRLHSIGCVNCAFVNRLDCSTMYVITNNEDVSEACRLLTDFKVKVINNPKEILKLAFQDSIEKIRMVEYDEKNLD